MHNSLFRKSNFKMYSPIQIQNMNHQNNEL